MTTSANDKVLAYQNGQSSLPLIEHFKSFIYSYVHFIKTGHLDLKKKNIRFLISLCIKDADTRYAVRFNKYLTKKEFKTVNGAIRYLRSYFYLYTEDDIYAELLIPFLRMSKRFELRDIPFDVYVIYNYNLAIKTYLREITREPNDFIERAAVGEESMDSIMDLALFDKFSTDEYSEAPVLQDLHDFRFMRGDKDVSGMFNEYSSVERFLLVHYYEDGWSDKKIAEHLGLHRQSVSRTRLRIVKKLEKMLESGDIKCARISEKYITVEGLLGFLTERNSSENSTETLLQS